MPARKIVTNDEEERRRLRVLQFRTAMALADYFQINQERHSQAVMSDLNEKGYFWFPRRLGWFRLEDVGDNDYIGANHNGEPAHENNSNFH